MLIIQRPQVEAGEPEGNLQQFTHRARSSPASATRSATAFAARCSRRSPAPRSRQVRFDEALHEFDVIPGVKEDVTDLILNLKDLVLRCSSEEPVTLRLDKRGPGDVTAGDIQTTADVEVLNPELHLATVNAKGRLAVDLTVEQGRGYLSAERNKRTSTIGLIPVDAIFSPVRRVAFSVEPTRVEQATNYDKLTPRDRDRRVDLAARRAGVGRRHAAQPRGAGRRPHRRAPRPRARRGGAVDARRPTSSCRSRSSSCRSGRATASSGRGSTPSASSCRRPRTTCSRSRTSVRSRSKRSSRSSTSAACRCGSRSREPTCRRRRRARASAATPRTSG